MTKKELKALPYDQLVDVCYKQEREFCKWRGQDSGLTYDMFASIGFPPETLIDCYLATQKQMEVRV